MNRLTPWLGAVALVVCLAAAGQGRGGSKAAGARHPERQEQPRDRNGLPAKARLDAWGPEAGLLQAPEGVSGGFVVAKQAPSIDFAIVPGQWEGAKLWSNWGGAIQGTDDKFYISIGDHDGPFGHAMVYRVDPGAKAVEMVVDVNEVLGRPKGTYTGGKIHAPIVSDGKGTLYFVTYRGNEKMTTDEYHYVGDPFFGYDEKTGLARNMGVLVPYCSAPVLEYCAEVNRLYGLAVTGESAPTPGAKFFAYDLARKKLAFSAPTEAKMNRAIIVAKDGTVFFESQRPAPGKATGGVASGEERVEGAERPGARKAIRGGGAKAARGGRKGGASSALEGILIRYDPRTNTATPTGARIPGDGNLRAASRPNREGVAYCLTRDGTVFEFNTKTSQAVSWDKKVFPFGTTYTAIVKLDPTEQFIYAVPAAHGGSAKTGSVIVQLDTKTRQVKALAFPNRIIRERYNYNLGGTFGIELSRNASQLLITWNGSRLPGKEGKLEFGLCSVMIVHVPESERSVHE